MIIDSHVHAFPFLGEASGFTNPEEFFALLQRGMATHRQPARRVRDGAVVESPPLWSELDSSPQGRRDINFRVGPFGRLMWTIDGIDYFKQYLPAWLEATAAGPDLLVALMDHAGVERCVLQNESYYGKLNEFFAACVRQYPQRFIGTIHVDENRAYADDQLRELHRGAREFRLRGLFFGPHQYWLHGESPALDDERMTVFWREVEALGLVVYWSLVQGSLADERSYLERLMRVRRVLDRHPRIRSVLVSGAANRYYDTPGAQLPEPLLDLGSRDGVCVEVAFPIYVGQYEDYPFPSAQRAIRHLYESFGPTKLVWGSDLPNVERHCTYVQSLTYLTRHCTFLPAADLELITGRSLLRLFGECGD